MARRYAFLRFRAGVDWQDVNPTLLVRMNRLGMYLNKVITITSGARGVPGHPNTGAAHSHHVPSNNPSGMGEAIDVYVGDRPLGSVVSSKTAARFGLFSGNRPGFYKGKPDPEHFETLERRGMKAPKDVPPQGQTQGQSQAPPAPALPADVTATQPSLETPQVGGPPAPEETQPGIYAPGAVPAGGFAVGNPIETWRAIAAQPLVSEDTQSILSRLGGG